MGGEERPPLLLIGTVHRDPRGKRKLLSLLRRVRPSVVSVEISPYARVFRDRNSAALRATLRENLRRIHQEEGSPWKDLLSHSAIQGIFLLLKEPYEWRAATTYVSETGSGLQDIDLSHSSEEKLAHLSDIVSRENLHTLLRLSSPSLSEQVENHYRRARFLFAHPPSVWVRSRDLEERESIMAQKIRRLFLRAEGKKLVHIGGWEHLLQLSEGLTLYNLLKDLRPRRLLLEDGQNWGLDPEFLAPQEKSRSQDGNKL
jgi:hypothetical protein